MRRRHSHRRTSRSRSNASERINVHVSRSRSSVGERHSSLLSQSAGARMTAISLTAPQRPRSVSSSTTGVSLPASLSSNTVGVIIPTTTSSGTLGGRRRILSIKSIASGHPRLGIGLSRRQSSQSGSAVGQRKRRQGLRHSTSFSRVPSHGRRIHTSTSSQPSPRLESFHGLPAAASSSAMQDPGVRSVIPYTRDKDLTDVHDQVTTSETVASTLKPLGGTISASIGTSLLSDWPKRRQSSTLAGKQQLSTDLLPVRNDGVQRGPGAGIHRSSEKGTLPTELFDISLKQALVKRLTGSKVDIAGTAELMRKLSAGKADIIGKAELCPALKPATPSSSSSSIDVVLQLKFKDAKDEPERTKQAAEQAQEQKSSKDNSEAWVVEYTESLLSTVPEVKELHVTPHESLFTPKNSSEMSALSSLDTSHAQSLTSQLHKRQALPGKSIPQKLDAANAIHEKSSVDYGALIHATAGSPPEPNTIDFPVTGTELVPRRVPGGTSRIVPFESTLAHIDTHAMPVLFSPGAKSTAEVPRLLGQKSSSRELAVYPIADNRLSVRELISVPPAIAHEGTEERTETSGSHYTEPAGTDSVLPVSPPATDISHIYEEPSPSPGGLFHMTPLENYDGMNKVAEKQEREIKALVPQPCDTGTVTTKPAQEGKALLNGAEQSVGPAADGGGVVLFQHTHQQRQMYKERTVHVIGEPEQEAARDRGQLLASKRTEKQFFKKATQVSKEFAPEHPSAAETHQVRHPVRLGSPTGHTVFTASGDDDKAGAADVETANSNMPEMSVPRDVPRHTQLEIALAQDVTGPPKNIGAIYVARDEATLSPRQGALSPCGPHLSQELNIDENDLEPHSPSWKKQSPQAFMGNSTMSTESGLDEAEPHHQWEHHGEAQQPLKEETITSPPPKSGNLTETNGRSKPAESAEGSEKFRGLAESFVHQEIKSTLESLSESCPKEVKQKMSVAYETFSPPEVEDTSLDTTVYDPQLQVREVDDYDMASITHERWEDTSTTVAPTMKTFFSYNPSKFLMCVNEEGERCGIIGVIVFEDEVAFCGFNLTKAEFRRNGVRRMLWDNMLAFDTGKNIFTIVPAERVYAYHTQLGFHTSREGLVLHGKLPPCNDPSFLRVPPKGDVVVKSFSLSMLPELLVYDKSVLGFGRRHFWDLTLQEASLTINVAVSRKQVRGYAGTQEDVRGTLVLRWLIAEDTNTARLLLYSLLDGSEKFKEDGLWVAFHVCSPAARSLMQYFDTTPLKPWMLIFNRREPFFQHESVAALTYI